ncbi:BglG family transcription antiterminator [Proteiniclasticum sp. C24MP]|uniref:BglG family transcription antiterminator n=1 Tax=Proteiniclasticum sp. C24MP TaxID=3374101 RepID=UPI003754A19B
MDDSSRVILEILVNNMNKSMTSSDISSLVHLSEKTVQNRIKKIRNILKTSGVELVSKPGEGYTLLIPEKDDLNKIKDILTVNEDYIPDTSEGRINYILKFLLNQQEYAKIDDLSDSLYVSRNTITSDLKEVEKILSLYDLSIDRRPNYGIQIYGEEFNKRVCIANCIYKNSMRDAKSSLQIDEGLLIAQMLTAIRKKYRLQIQEYLFENLIVQVYVAIERIKNGNSIAFSSETKNEMHQLISEFNFQIAIEVTNKIKEIFDVEIREDDTLYLALHLSGKVSNQTNLRTGKNLIVSQSIDKLVTDMVNVIYNTLRIDFRSNLDLRMSLIQHMVSFDIRMRYDLTIKNPILTKVKKDHAYAYNIALCASIVLNRYYEKDVPEDELGFFAILFALGAQNNNIPLKKYNIVIVCVSGRGTSQLFIQKYKQTFYEYINKIYDLTMFDLEKFDFRGNNIDFVFTTVPLNVTLEVPVHEVSVLLNHEEIASYKRLFEYGDSSFLYKYFNKSLFFPNLKVSSKVEALKSICDLTDKYVKLPADFYDLVMKREEMGQTDFGNLVAIPHPYKIITNTSIIACAVLQNSVFWGKHNVQVVFLVSFGLHEDEEVEKFYHVITNFLSNEELVKNVIEKPTFENLIEQLTKANRMKYEKLSH